MTPIEKIASSHIPTNSPVAAIQHMREHGWFEKTGDDYKFHIVDIAGAEALTDDERELNYTLRYLVTEVIGNPELRGRLLVDLAATKAKHFIENNQYVFAKPEADAEPRLDAMGNVKPKKGAKKEMARKVYDEQIKDVEGMTRKAAIEILVEEVGLSPAGASTYYANLKKGAM